MNNYREILTSLLWRTLAAVAVGSVGWLLLATATGGWSAFPRLLFGMACIVAAAIIVAPPIARLIAENSGNLFYPGKHFSRPQPMYSIPQSKRARGLYEEAIAGFEEIARDYPDDVVPYIAMIEIAIIDLKDPQRANAFYRRGISLLKKEQDREALARMYSAVRSRLKTRP